MSRGYFTIRNLGQKDLLLYGGHIVVIDGPDWDHFEVISQPYTPFETPPITIAPGGTRTFVVRFSANSEGQKTVSFSIVNSDWNENPYDITLTGTGIIGGNKVAEETAFVVTSPTEGEKLEPGAVHLITWTGAEEAQEVKIEYSADNGTVYQTIVERAPNTGSYPWLVPPVMSGLCLVRVSNADGAAAQGETLSLEFKLKISASESETEAPGLSVRVSIPDLKTVTSWTADVVFAAEGPSGVPGVSLNSARAETGAFSGRWHTVGLVIRPGTLTGALFLDGKPVLDGVPLVQGAWAGASPDIIVRCAGAAGVRVEDLEARYKDLELKPKIAGEEVSQALVKDSFEGYPTGVFPGQGGWRAPGAQTLGLIEGMLPDAAQSPSTSSLKKLADRTANGREGGISLAVGTEEANRQADQAQIGSESAFGSGKAVVDEADSVTGLRSFLLAADGKSELVVAKRLSLPSRVPFGVSDGNFVIGVAKMASPMRTVSRSRLLEEIGLGDRSDRSGKVDDRVSRRKSETANEEQVPGIAKAGRNPSRSSDKTMKLMSASPVGNFYIYSFDGKLLQMYDVYGALLKDYIYMGDRLIAEYDHVGSRFLYYTPDQINTTRVITDQGGNVVYSVVHDPYGGIQQTGQNNSYDPQLKFSGKERDVESDLDYFGARYYDRTQYRFISVDPRLVLQDALADPQRWNLYAYCADNPVNMTDLSGTWGCLVHGVWTYRLAVMAGIPAKVALQIGQANKDVDYKWETGCFRADSPSVLKKWHFISTERFFEALEICETTLNAKELGKYLHVIQDYYAHSSVSLMGGYSHVGPGMERYAGIDDPYSNYHEWSKTMEMAQLTFDLMQAFQERVLALAADIATSLALCMSGI